MEAQPLRPNFLAEATKVWQSADEARKKTFLDQAEAAKAKYKIDLDAYNEARAKLGGEVEVEDDDQRRK